MLHCPHPSPKKAENNPKMAINQRIKKLLVNIGIVGLALIKNWPKIHQIRQNKKQEQRNTQPYKSQIEPKKGYELPQIR